MFRGLAIAAWGLFLAGCGYKCTVTCDVDGVNQTVEGEGCTVQEASSEMHKECSDLEGEEVGTGHCTDSDIAGCPVNGGSRSASTNLIPTPDQLSLSAR